MDPVKGASWWNGEAYAAHSRGQVLLAQEALSKYSFRGHESVLDIGCGDGKITADLANRCASVIGIDSSSSMIAKANELFSQKTRFLLGNGEDFKLNQRFDLIVSFSALHWIKNQKAVWNNIRHHLKLGGHALVSLNPLPRCPFLAEAIEEVTHLPEFNKYFENFSEEVKMPFMTIDEYRELIIKAGFKVIECRQSQKAFIYENKESLIDNVMAWLPHVAEVPNKREFVTHIIQRFLEKSGQRERGEVKLPFNNFLVLCEY